MDPITVNLPSITEMNVWILPAAHTLGTVIFAGLFMRYAKQAGQAQGDRQSANVAKCVGAAIIGATNLVMVVVMSWHLFAKAIDLRGY